MINNMKVIDAHIHYNYPIDMDKMVDIINKSGADVASLVIVPSRDHLSSSLEALMFKHKMNNKYYVFSNLDVSGYFIHKKHLGKYFKKYTKLIRKCGADGIKIIEGKPNMRHDLPVPDFDDPVWDEFFSYAESEQIPILWHVNDPEENWDLEKASEAAIKNGWAYGPDYINNEVQYKQIENLLNHHPNLKIIFAHFYFMSRQLDRLASILDKYKGVNVDLTPGVEMYKNFSDNIEKTREFFKKYQDRIIYGSDIGARVTIKNSGDIDEVESLERACVVSKFISDLDESIIQGTNHFLEEGDSFKLIPLKLDKDIQEKLYYKNFISLVGEPKPVDSKRTLKEISRVYRIALIMGMVNKEVKVKKEIFKEIKTYFKNNK